MPKLIVMIGIPSSGKSTYARIHYPEALIVSTDDIREELAGTAEDQSKNRRVFEAAHARVLAGLLAEKDVVFDATNLRPAYRANLLGFLAGKVEFEAHAIVMDVTVEEALKLQENRGRKVPEEVIRRFAKSFTPPREHEGFKEVQYIRPTA